MRVLKFGPQQDAGMKPKPHTAKELLLFAAYTDDHPNLVEQLLAASSQALVREHIGWSGICGSLIGAGDDGSAVLRATQEYINGTILSINLSRHTYDMVNVQVLSTSAAGSLPEQLQI
jgi:hypothetical protein